MTRCVQLACACKECHRIIHFARILPPDYSVLWLIEKNGWWCSQVCDDVLNRASECSLMIKYFAILVTPLPPLQSLYQTPENLFTWKSDLTRSFRITEHSEHEIIQAKLRKYSLGKWTLKEDFRTSGTPKQDNGYDCGVPYEYNLPHPIILILKRLYYFIKVFTCMFAHYLSLDLDLRFSQKDMITFRERITLCLHDGELDLR